MKMLIPMKWFQDLSIRRKLVILFVALGCLTAIAVSVPMGIYDYAASRRAMARDLTILADVLAQNSSAALTFHDSEAAKDALQALRAEPNITIACIYTIDGKPLAIYVRDRLGSAVVAPPPETPSVRFQDDRLIAFRKIELAGETIGTL